ncbi:hypothetical protein P153DRAFT_348185 [Dothidotthia symphoricarpi CBS 119687]|uniref:SnoaL-like domain-containing protein n=1 Tax=Dothidotthia symphoricarpi CBS 119687 TaxID=1392245 RepID=A0A6A6A311_9PLEO|nr:uncharacterized protein P153DRAFT_348185 [Dothidotthia symphoricarpi CBS 119687]KAF2125936.1 hypothetical protein P153DRAFT_348185 [Dothidotthia symphoricarpi CBS 119687]
MSAYTSQYPPLPFDPAYKQFFESFYAASDDPTAHDAYVENFTHDATLIMASKTAKGGEEILAVRKSLWEKVASRKHDAVKIFPFGPDSDEVMLYGTVTYGLKSGGESGLDWAARACLVKEGGRVRMRYYQVYLDTGAQGK